MNCKWCAYAHHLEQQTRMIIQGTRSVRSGWTEANGSASGVFGVKDLNKLDFVSWPGTRGHGSWFLGWHHD